MRRLPLRGSRCFWFEPNGEAAATRAGGAHRHEWSPNVVYLARLTSLSCPSLNVAGSQFAMQHAIGPTESYILTLEGRVSCDNTEGGGSKRSRPA